MSTMQTPRVHRAPVPRRSATSERSAAWMDRAAVGVVAALVTAGCGGGGGSSSCVDFDADRPIMDAELVALSEAVTDLSETFEHDPPVLSSLTVESVSEVDVVDAGGGYEYDVANGVSVVLVGDISVADTGIFRSLVGGCSEAGWSEDPSGDDSYRAVVGFTGDRAVHFLVEDGRLTVSEYDR